MWYSHYTIIHAVRDVCPMTVFIDLCHSPWYHHTRKSSSSVPKISRNPSFNTTFRKSLAFHVTVIYQCCRQKFDVSALKAIHGSTAWIIALFPQGIRKCYVEKLLSLYLYVLSNDIKLSQCEIFCFSRSVVFLIATDTERHTWVPYYLHCA